MKRLIRKIFLVFVIALTVSTIQQVTADTVPTQADVTLTSYFDRNNVVSHTAVQDTVGNTVAFDTNVGGESGYSFAYWIVNGNVERGLALDYTFTLQDDLDLVAVFAPDGQYVALFMDANLNLLDVRYTTTGDATVDDTGMDLPSKPGYLISTDRWGQGVGVTEMTLTQNEVFTLQYTRVEPSTYTLTVTGATGSGTYDYDEVVTLSAEASQFVSCDAGNVEVTGTSNCVDINNRVTIDDFERSSADLGDASVAGYWWINKSAALDTIVSGAVEFDTNDGAIYFRGASPTNNYSRQWPYLLVRMKGSTSMTLDSFRIRTYDGSVWSDYAYNNAGTIKDQNGDSVQALTTDYQWYIIDLSATGLIVNFQGFQIYMGGFGTLGQVYIDEIAIADTVTRTTEYFQSWSIGGETVSYDTSYSLTVLDDTSVVANYAEGTPTTTAVMRLSEPMLLREGYHSYLGQFYIPSGYELVEFGFVMTQTTGIPELGAVGTTKVVSDTYHQVTHEYMMSFPTTSGIASIRSYMLIKNTSSGVVSSVYSSVYDYSSPGSFASGNTPVLSVTFSTLVIATGNTFDPLTNISVTDTEDNDTLLTANITFTVVDSNTDPVYEPGDFSDLSAGTYTITFRVTDSDGNTDTVTMTLTIS